MAIQLSELLTEFGLLKQDISNLKEETYLAWCRYVSRFVYNKLIYADPERYILTNQYAAINGSQALPVNFKNVRPKGTGFFLLNNDGSNTATNNQLGYTSYGSEYQGYYLNNTEVVFTGINDTLPVMLRYTPKLTSYTSTDQYFTIDGTINGIEIINDEYIDYLIYALDVWYGIWDGEPSAEAMSDQRFVRSLDSLIYEFKRTPRSVGISNPSRVF